VSTPSDLLALRTQLGERLRLNEPLSRHTSFRIGGPADVFVDATSVEDLRAVHRFVAITRTPCWILGGGTNVLVSDDGVRGVVLHLGRSFAALEWHPNGNGTHVRAGAALTFKKLVTEALARDLAGLEFAEGIPGSVGGGLLMNAGAFGGEISNVVEYVEGVDARASLVQLQREQLSYGYRRFDLPERFIVTAVGFRLDPGDRQALRAKRDEAKRKREANQPLGYPNAGSIFKNPPGTYAGRLLQSAGMKGFRVGNAQISEQHANFIVNLGGATAADVRAIMREATARVLHMSGIRLEPEVKLVGEWPED